MIKEIYIKRVLVFACIAKEYGIFYLNNIAVTTGDIP
jgi:hypothetical protein